LDAEIFKDLARHTRLRAKGAHERGASVPLSPQWVESRQLT
jgi:hypothetical protein